MKETLDIFLYKLLSFFSSPSFAEDSPPELDSAVIVGFIHKITGFITPVASILAVAFIIYGGYMWIISGGDPEKLKKAQGTLTWAIIGLVFTILSRVILGLIYNGLQS